MRSNNPQHIVAFKYLKLLSLLGVLSRATGELQPLVSVAGCDRVTATATSVFS